jgi:hypothetical protein
MKINKRAYIRDHIILYSLTHKGDDNFHICMTQHGNLKDKVIKNNKIKLVIKLMHIALFLLN